MAKKKNLEETIIECWEGTKKNRRHFKERSDDYFIGYATAMTMRDNLNQEWSIEEIHNTVRMLLEEGKI